MESFSQVDEVKASSQIDEENMSFITLIEEYKVMLSKAQSSVVKKMKKLALAAVIEKWSILSGKQLTEKAILKKLSNLKVRANSASKNGEPLDEWQKKILQVAKEVDEVPAGPIIIEVPSSVSSGGSSAPTTNEQQLSAHDVMMGRETLETKLLSDEQLKRVILLEQLKVLELQRKKMERDLSNDINFELIEFNGNNPTDFNDVQ